MTQKKKTRITFVDVKEVELKKGWSLGIDRKTKTKKLTEIIRDSFSSKMKRK